MGNRTKKVLLGVLLAIMALPMLQQQWPFVQGTGLYGSFTMNGDAAFRWNTWFDGSYRDQKELFYNDHLGFRSDLTRLNNQVDYSLFGKLHTDWTVMGKENCLFNTPYITCYYGDGFLGTDSIGRKLLQIKALQDTLGKLGKTLLIAHAACKGSFYPEFFPDNMHRDTLKPSNYTTYVRLADSLGVHSLDLNAYLCSLKKTEKELLYTKLGIHWSCYGAALAADSLIKCLEQLQQAPLPHVFWTTTEHTTDARLTDDDIGKALNLVWPVTKETYCYPSLQYSRPEAAQNSRALYIGDSFIWTWIDLGILDMVHHQWEFWFYMRQRFPQDAAHKREPAPMPDDWLAELDKYNTIVVMYTANNLHLLGNGFIEKAYAHYFPAP